LIIWLNGAFGVGKTTATTAMIRQAPRMAAFDPEEIGSLITRVRCAPSGDYQDLPAWRHLVIATVAELAGHACAPLVVPMTLLNEGYAREIFDGIHGRGAQITHVVLHCEPDELAARIDGDMLDGTAAVVAARRIWRHSRLPAYYQAVPMLHRLGKPLVIDTTKLSAAEVARRVLRSAAITYQEHR
jgi:hypothetical protein